MEVSGLESQIFRFDQQWKVDFGVSWSRTDNEGPAQANHRSQARHQPKEPDPASPC